MFWKRDLFLKNWLRIEYIWSRYGCSLSFLGGFGKEPSSFVELTNVSSFVSAAKSSNQDKVTCSVSTKFKGSKIFKLQRAVQRYNKTPLSYTILPYIRYTYPYIVNIEWNIVCIIKYTKYFYLHLTKLNENKHIL